MEPSRIQRSAEVTDPRVYERTWENERQPENRSRTYSKNILSWVEDINPVPANRPQRGNGKQIVGVAGYRSTLSPLIGRDESSPVKSSNDVSLNKRGKNSLRFKDEDETECQYLITHFGKASSCDGPVSHFVESSNGSEIVNRSKRINSQRRSLEPSPNAAVRESTPRKQSELFQISPEFSYEEIKAATNGFATTLKLGEGASGTVYRGELRSGTSIAVKVMKVREAGSGFEEEIRVLSMYRHPNLVTLLGFVRKNHICILVYEYLDGGDLCALLHRGHPTPYSISLKELPGSSLHWTVRLSAATDAACGLSYLHSRTPKVFHRDIKSSNILLDCHGAAKLADFGLAAWAQEATPNKLVVRTAEGTPGYADPSYINNLELRPESETFSFGMVLMELLTGRAPALYARTVSGPPVLRYFRDMLGHGDIDSLCRDWIDWRAKWPLEAARTIGRLAFSCTDPVEEQRPTMWHVLEVLKGMCPHKRTLDRDWRIFSKLYRRALRKENNDVETSGSSSNDSENVSQHSPRGRSFTCSNNNDPRGFSASSDESLQYEDARCAPLRVRANTAYNAASELDSDNDSGRPEFQNRLSPQYGQPSPAIHRTAAYGEQQRAVAYTPDGRQTRYRKGSPEIKNPLSYSNGKQGHVMEDRSAKASPLGEMRHSALRNNFQSPPEYLKWRELTPESSQQQLCSYATSSTRSGRGNRAQSECAEFGSDAGGSPISWCVLCAQSKEQMAGQVDESVVNVKACGTLIRSMHLPSLQISNAEDVRDNMLRLDGLLAERVQCEDPKFEDIADVDLSKVVNSADLHKLVEEEIASLESVCREEWGSYSLDDIEVHFLEYASQGIGRDLPWFSKTFKTVLPPDSYTCVSRRHVKVCACGILLSGNLIRKSSRRNAHQNNSWYSEGRNLPAGFFKTETGVLFRSPSTFFIAECLAPNGMFIDGVGLLNQTDVYVLADGDIIMVLFGVSPVPAGAPRQRDVIYHRALGGKLLRIDNFLGLSFTSGY